MSLIKADKVTFEYIRRDKDGAVEGVNKAVNEVDMGIEQGQFIAILGHNGSGKSTLAKHFNALLHPVEGTVFVDGMDTRDEDHVWDIRQTAGMVFQNPDNQIIGTVVEEDVAFGPENMGVPSKEIWERVQRSLKSVDMYTYRKHSPSRLSGGQKQRIAIAGVLAMQPKCIVLDEPTAMLDPVGRREVINAVMELNKKEKITVILITHYMEEVVNADKIFVMDKGKVVMSGSPREVFSRVEELKEIGLSVPQVTLLAEELRSRGVNMPAGILTSEELVGNVTTGTVLSDTFCERYPQSQNYGKMCQGEPSPMSHSIIADGLSYTYSQGTAYEVKALDEVSFKIEAGEYIGLLGHTGSGKSTLVQVLDGLLKPTSGTVYIDGEDIFDKEYKLKSLRSKVGIVFQYPEHQLFEADVFTDVCFGPRNLGLSRSEVELRAYEALKQVGLSDEAFYQSPFDLSGGEKRRVAIAGVLAMKPQVLILDEPTAGLDPAGRQWILELVARLRKENGMTIILVSHSMDDLAENAERLMVMDKGRLVMDGPPIEVFKYHKELREMGLDIPEAVKVLYMLKENGVNVSTDAITIADAASEIMKGLKS
ncbi:MAG: energy-coupling factor transporter ATPase [Lachnospiraceae bacterium]|nr:energy-coupling factor transporter ATPase [Lachnospiraceae bacterium]